MNTDKFMGAIMAYLVILCVVAFTGLILMFGLFFVRNVVDPAHDNLYCQNRSFGPVCITPMPEGR